MPETYTKETKLPSRFQIGDEVLAGSIDVERSEPYTVESVEFRKDGVVVYWVMDASGYIEDFESNKVHPI